MRAPPAPAHGARQVRPASALSYIVSLHRVHKLPSPAGHHRFCVISLQPAGAAERDEQAKTTTLGRLIEDGVSVQEGEEIAAVYQFLGIVVCADLSRRARIIRPPQHAQHSRVLMWFCDAAIDKKLVATLRKSVQQILGSVGTSNMICLGLQEAIPSKKISENIDSCEDEEANMATGEHNFGLNYQLMLMLHKKLGIHDQVFIELHHKYMSALMDKYLLVQRDINSYIERLAVANDSGYVPLSGELGGYYRVRFDDGGTFISGEDQVVIVDGDDSESSDTGSNNRVIISRAPYPLTEDDVHILTRKINSEGSTGLIPGTVLLHPARASQFIINDNAPNTQRNDPLVWIYWGDELGDISNMAEHALGVGNFEAPTDTKPDPINAGTTDGYAKFISDFCCNQPLLRLSEDALIAAELIELVANIINSGRCLPMLIGGIDFSRLHDVTQRLVEYFNGRFGDGANKIEATPTHEVIVYNSNGEMLVCVQIVSREFVGNIQTVENKMVENDPSLFVAALVAHQWLKYMRVIGNNGHNLIPQVEYHKLLNRLLDMDGVEYSPGNNSTIDIRDIHNLLLKQQELEMASAQCIAIGNKLIRIWQLLSERSTYRDMQLADECSSKIISIISLKTLSEACLSRSILPITGAYWKSDIGGDLQEMTTSVKMSSVLSELIREDVETYKQHLISGLNNSNTITVTDNSGNDGMLTLDIVSRDLYSLLKTKTEIVRSEMGCMMWNKQDCFIRLSEKSFYAVKKYIFSNSRSSDDRLSMTQYQLEYYPQHESCPRFRPLLISESEDVPIDDEPCAEAGEEFVNVCAEMYSTIKHVQLTLPFVRTVLGCRFGKVYTYGYYYSGNTVSSVEQFRHASTMKGGGTSFITSQCNTNEAVQYIQELGFALCPESSKTAITGMSLWRGGEREYQLDTDFVPLYICQRRKGVKCGPFDYSRKWITIDVINHPKIRKIPLDLRFYIRNSRLKNHCNEASERDAVPVSADERVPQLWWVPDVHGHSMSLQQCSSDGPRFNFVRIRNITKYRLANIHCESNPVPGNYVQVRVLDITEYTNPDNNSIFSQIRTQKELDMKIKKHENFSLIDSGKRNALLMAFYNFCMQINCKARKI